MFTNVGKGTFFQIEDGQIICKLVCSKSAELYYECLLTSPVQASLGRLLRQFGNIVEA